MASATQSAELALGFLEQVVGHIVRLVGADRVVVDERLEGLAEALPGSGEPVLVGWLRIGLGVGVVLLHDSR